MRLCILNLTSGNMCWGYRNYLTCLVPLLAAHPQVEAVLVGIPRNIDIQVCRIPGVEWVSLRCGPLSRGREVAGSAKKMIKAFAPDIIFIPTSRYWKLDGVPVATMVRNMMPATHTHATRLLDRMKNWARFFQMQRSAKKSARVIAVSKFVGAYLAQDLVIPDHMIGVVHHGVATSEGESGRQPLSIPDAWHGSFVLTAGSIYSYRGLEDLIFAWEHLSGQPSRPFLVVAGFVGRGMQKYYARLRMLVREKNLDDCIRFVGLLSRPEMTWCYRHCRALVMTSRVEACPNIALEAMAHGCLCVSTDNPPMPEIFGDAARYYTAGDAGALAQRVLEVLQLPADCQQQAKRFATARAAEFSWETCCDRTVRELQKVIVQ